MSLDTAVSAPREVAGRPRLLIVDDEATIAPVLQRFAHRFGFDVDYKPSGREALVSLGELRPDVAMIDLQMPELGGIDVLKAMRAADPHCQLILMTGNASVDTAVEAVKAGAVDYLSKPFDFNRLGHLLAGLRRSPADLQPASRSDPRTVDSVDFHGMVGQNAAMQELFASIRRVAPYIRTVLITGETGTGKELVAKALHREGRRRDKRFLAINCAAVVETLFESELFGHVRGAFTGATDTTVGLFEHADGGTLFLDEAGELPLSLQSKLLRAVEYGETQRVGSLETRRSDVCVIAATNHDLRGETAAGRFRSDLFYRLSVFEVHLPSLRDRPDDIPRLATTFIRECAARLERKVSGLTPDGERLLRQSPWPGNVRELRNVIERACLLTQGTTLTTSDLVASMPTSRVIPFRPAAAALGTTTESLSNRLSTAQEEQIRRVLRGTRGNKKLAAELLGISRRSLYRWMHRLDLDL